MRKISAVLSLVLMLVLTTTRVKAQENLSIETEKGLKVGLGADLVSRYVWRGMDQGSGVSVQPTLSLELGKFSLSAWGSTSLSYWEPKEFDISLSFEHEGFSAVFTDYFWAGESASYGHYKDDHFYELGLSYCFGDKVPLTLNWNTMLFAGENGELDEEGKRMFSSYFNMAYDFDVKGVTLTPSMGFNMWKSQYHDKFAVMDIKLTASKTFEITDKFSLPVFVEAIVSPACDKAYLVAGISF